MGVAGRRGCAMGARRRRSAIGPSIVSLILLLSVLLPGATAAAASPAPSPAASWRPAGLPPEESPVDLTPTETRGGVALDAGFLLTSTGLPARELAERITVEPAIALAIEGPDALGVVTLRPTASLAPSTAYVFRLHDPDGALVRSWRFVTRGPLRLVSTLPSDWSDGVPVTTGIELTFDVEGVTDLLDHLLISPPVAGSVLTKGRTLVFLPTGDLAPGTEYAVTITAGLPVAGTGQVLPEDETIHFTTQGPGAGRGRIGAFARNVAETTPREPAVLEIGIWRSGITSVPLEIWRYPGIAAAAAAAGALQARDVDGEQPPVVLSTEGLVRVLAQEVSLRKGNEAEGENDILVLPGVLDPGWYLVRIPDPRGDLDLLLQVSDLAAYTHMSWTRTAVWAHDLATRKPAAGATVEVLGGASLGTTGADGLLLAETPEALIPGDVPQPILVIRRGADTLLVPFGTSGWEGGDIVRTWDEGPLSDAWWSLLYTDRSIYRTTDTVAIWGMARLRDGGVPRPLTLRLSYWPDDADDPVAVAELAVTPSAETGGYEARLPIVDLPHGWYDLDLLDGERILRRTGMEIAEIVKPEYRLFATTPRRVYISGETVRAAVDATTFDGTTVPAVPLVGTLYAGERTARARATTGADGSAELGFVASAASWDQWTYGDLRVRPARAEEAEIEGVTGIVLFQAAVVLDAEARIADDLVILAGDLSQVDRPRLEKELGGTADGILDPRGKRIAGGSVRAIVTEITPIRRQVGTDYDWIAREVVPLYEYSEERAIILDRRLVTDTEGRFRLELPADPEKSYEIDLSASDPSGRTTTLETWASSHFGWVDWGAYLTATGADADPWWPHISVPLGRPVTVEMRTSEGVVPTGGANRYLFLTEQRGIRDAVVGREPRVTVTLGKDDPPLLEVTGVRFTGRTYVAIPDGFAVDFDPASRGLQVTIAADAPRHAPGERATVTVTVRDRDGAPVAADVTLRAVDEKLYAIGAATAIDPLGDLYSSVSTGTTRTYASHQLPRRGSRGEGGDTGGGADLRTDFRDQALFQVVRTDASGTATVSFDLPDDLTSWRVSGMALDGTLRAGEGTTLLPVGLPFFVSIVAPPDLLVSDRAAIRVRTNGADLAAGEAVTVELSAPSLGLGLATRQGTAFSEVTIPLPALTEGEHPLTVRAWVTSDPDRSDGLVRTIRVVPSRLAATRTAWAPVTGPAPLPAADGLVHYLVTDAGRGSLLPVLLELAEPNGLRAEQVLAAAEARRILAESFGIGPERFGSQPAAIAAWQTPSGGFAILPYGPPDVTVSFLVALTDPAGIDRVALAAWLSDWEEGEPVTATAGRAVLGERIGNELADVATRADLTIVDRLAIGIAAASIGDETLARSIARSVIEQRGERMGAFLRLRTGAASPDHAATALLGILAAMTGDLATSDAVEAWLAVDPPADFPAELHRVAIARARLARSGSEPAAFAVTIAGERTEVTLAAGEHWSASLLSTDQAGATIEPIAGAPILAATWRAAIDPASVIGDPAVTIARSVTPSGPIASDAEVVVRIRVDLGESPVPGCTLVTDLVPSGLAPVQTTITWRHRDETELPISIDGRRVTWCLGPDRDHPVRELAYAARVVTPGFYAWEPVLVQPALALERITLGMPATVEIR